MKRFFVLLGIALLTGCTTNTGNDAVTPNDTITPTEISRCAEPTPDVTDPNDVADAAALTLACHDTSSDTSSFDAMRRAAPLLDDTLTDGLPTTAPADAAWTEMSSHEAYTEVSVEAIIMEEEPDLSAPPVILTRTTTATPTGKDGWKGTPETLTWSFTIDETTDGTWIITDLTV